MILSDISTIPILDLTIGMKFSIDVGPILARRDVAGMKKATWRGYQVAASKELEFNDYSFDYAAEAKNKTKSTSSE